MAVVEVPFVYEADVRTGQSRKPRRTRILDTVFAEVPEVEASAVDRLPAYGGSPPDEWIGSGGLLYQAVRADGAQLRLPDLAPETLGGPHSPFLRRGYDGPSDEVGTARKIEDLRPREVSGSSQAGDRARAVIRAQATLLVEGRLYAPSRGPFVRLYGSSPKMLVAMTYTGVTAPPGKDAEWHGTALTFPWSMRDVAVETARARLARVDDKVVLPDWPDLGTSVGECDIVVAALHGVADKAGALLARALSDEALLTIADLKEATDPTPAQVADMVGRLSTALDGAPTFKWMDRAALLLLADRARALDPGPSPVP